MTDGSKLISRLLRDGATNVLRDLNEDLFQDDELRQYQFVLSHFRAEGVLPHPSTVTENTGLRLPDAPEPVDYYLRRLFNRRRYNWLRDFFPDIRECFTTKDMDRAANIFSEGARFMRGGGDGQIVRNIAEAGQDMLTAYHARQISGGGIPTGWPTLDNTLGGYMPGNLYSWVARTGQGKTFTSLKQCFHAWRSGYSVMYITFEMPIEELMQRNTAFFAEVNPRGLQSGQMSTQAIRRIQSRLDALEDVTRFHMVGDSLTPRVSSIISYIDEYSPDIIFIDGAAFLKSDSSTKNANRLERIQDVMDEIKQITLRRRKPVVQTLQFNRQAGKKGKDGSLETIGLTDLVGQHSSAVMKLSPANDLGDELIVEIMKNRHGPTATFNINYKFSPPNFEETRADDWEQIDHEESLFDEE